MFCDPNTPQLEPAICDFYRDAMKHLEKARVDFLVGGAYALAQYTGIERHTCDFDLFLRRRDVTRALEALEKAGYRTELTFPHWLGKAYYCGNYIDLIFSSGNAICEVDDEWFMNARSGVVFGVSVKLVPPEEMIWPKAYIMERERFDGADVAHLIRSCAKDLNWDRLLRRMGNDWRVLLSHLITFGFVYPAERSVIPTSVMNELLARLGQELNSNDQLNRACKGTLLSRAQYLVDIECLGYGDPRIKPSGKMTEEEITIWTQPVREHRMNG